jgi:catechol 2,3-dioxygenase-like lactoylglutathione lyase family enzyme
MPLNALHHVALKTADLEASRDFYCDILVSSLISAPTNSLSREEMLERL